MGVEILTWGYQGRTIEMLTQVVQDETVDMVVDVRGNPYSRHPQWCKEGLERVLKDRYRWIGWLGDERYRTGGAFELRDPQRGMEELARLIEGGAQRILLLCYERRAQDCHRSLVAEMASKRFGATVRHLE